MTIPSFLITAGETVSIQYRGKLDQYALAINVVAAKENTSLVAADELLESLKAS